jgi:phage-related protein
VTSQSDYHCTARAFYAAARGRLVVIFGVFVKKTQQAPRHEIDLALSRAKEALP